MLRLRCGRWLQKYTTRANRSLSDKRLPVLFVHQTSDLSETSRAQVCGVPIIPVDGGDVVAVYRVATESITHARKGNGPTLIDCIFEPSEARDPSGTAADVAAPPDFSRWLIGLGRGWDERANGS